MCESQRGGNNQLLTLAQDDTLEQQVRHWPIVNLHSDKLSRWQDLVTLIDSSWLDMQNTGLLLHSKHTHTHTHTHTHANIHTHAHTLTHTHTHTHTSNTPGHGVQWQPTAPQSGGQNWDGEGSPGTSILALAGPLVPRLKLQTHRDLQTTSLSFTPLNLRLISYSYSTAWALIRLWMQ